MEKKSELENLKKEYKVIQKKHNLPSFEQLNEDFHIEKIAEIETDFLTREIRRFMTEKFLNYLRFIETILHPINAPMSIFSIIKSLGIEEKKQLTEIYKKLAKTEIVMIRLDLNFSEKKDADFIKKYYKLWQEIKNDLLNIVEVIEKNLDNKFDAGIKGYFG